MYNRCYHNLLITPVIQRQLLSNLDINRCPLHGFQLVVPSSVKDLDNKLFLRCTAPLFLFVLYRIF